MTRSLYRHVAPAALLAGAVFMMAPQAVRAHQHAAGKKGGLKLVRSGVHVVG